MDRYPKSLRIRTQEVLDETVDYYLEDLNRRALVELDYEASPRCAYLTEDGRCCAVGRCFDELTLKIVHAAYEGVPASAIFQRMNSFVDRVIDGFHIQVAEDGLQPKYQGLPLIFWERLQTLHDTKVFWDYEENRLTPQGHSYYCSVVKECGYLETSKYYHAQ